MHRYPTDALVGREWLERHLNDSSIRIVEVDEDPTAYDRAHIPGAIGFDWRLDLQDQVVRRFLEPQAFGRLLGSRGVSNQHLVIVYGDRNNWFAAYAYWYLKYYGQEAVRLLDGSRELWMSEGRPTTTQGPSHPPTTFVAGPGDENIRATRDDVLSAIGGAQVLIDVRARQEYLGNVSIGLGCGSEGAQRSGHIPGACSIPWARAVNEDGTFKPVEELRELYRQAGALTGSPIITYCSIGERSAHTWFVLHELLGYQSVKNYEGSWTEWGNMVGAPIEKGDGSGSLGRRVV
jgi:thiosulfate/3-mercaptopyruvate sulfurtransferase